MAMTRGMTAKLNQNASNLLPEILFSIIMRLGVIDFIAFSGVCKSWRTVARSNWNTFMLSRQPMAIRISIQESSRKECWLEDCERRRFRTVLPRSSGRACVGLVSGYLVLFGRKTHDFRLVNPITRHELHFPRFPFRLVANPDVIRCTLAFLRPTSRWVFVISRRFSSTVSFSLSGKQASWTHLSSDLPIKDLIFFKGKIYTVNTKVGLCEVRLDPIPTLTPLNMKNSVPSHFVFPEFATLGEKLFVKDYRPKDPYPVEVDVDQMKWVINELELLEEPHMLYLWFAYYIRTRKNKNKRVRNMSYVPKKCVDVNILHE